MPHYVSLMRWTSQAHGPPAWRRVEEGERTIEEAGGKLVGVGDVGPIHVVEVFEAPGRDGARDHHEAGRHGAEETEALRAFTRDEAEEIIRRFQRPQPGLNRLQASAGALLGDFVQPLADLLGRGADVVEPRQLRQARAEDARRAASCGT
jgi:uncharacterized protein with GYD domain